MTFEYEAANEDELGLKLGDIVEFIEEEEVGWFKGRLNSKVGVFPSNFVEPYSEPAPATRSEPSKPEKPPPPAPIEEHTKGETGIDGLSSSTDDNRQPTKREILCGGLVYLCVGMWAGVYVHMCGLCVCVCVCVCVCSMSY